MKKFTPILFSLIILFSFACSDSDDPLPLSNQRIVSHIISVGETCDAGDLLAISAPYVIETGKAVEIELYNYSLYEVDKFIFSVKDADTLVEVDYYEWTKDTYPNISAWFYSWLCVVTTEESVGKFLLHAWFTDVYANSSDVYSIAFTMVSSQITAASLLSPINEFVNVSISGGPR